MVCAFSERATRDSPMRFRRDTATARRPAVFAVVAFICLSAIGSNAAIGAQTPTDSLSGPSPSRQADSTTLSRAWFSLGLGGASVDIAARAAASIAVTPVALLTLEALGVGVSDGSMSSINLMAGAQTSDPTGFLFASAGLANVSCGSGCRHQTGIALEAGFHGGWSNAGLGVVAFAIRAPGESSFAGIVATVDVGRFGQRPRSLLTKRSTTK